MSHLGSLKPENLEQLALCSKFRNRVYKTVRDSTTADKSSIVFKLASREARVKNLWYLPNTAAWKLCIQSPKYDTQLYEIKVISPEVCR